MAETTELKAWARQRLGKGGARATRREGRIPGILYGDKKEPESISVDYRAISKQLLTGHFQSTVFTLNVEGTKTRVIPRGVQLDPVRDFPIHVDFLRVSKDALVTVDVPVRFLNEAVDPVNQANLPLHIDYGPANPKAFDTGVIKPERAVQLPSSPENVRKQALMSYEWWSSPQGEAAEKRWAAFMQK